MKPRRAAAHRSFVSPFDKAPEEPKEPEVYEIGARVSHDQHGLGVVSAFEGTTAIIIDFGPGHRRRINLPCAKMCRL